MLNFKHVQMIRFPDDFDFPKHKVFNRKKINVIYWRKFKGDEKPIWKAEIWHANGVEIIIVDSLNELLSNLKEYKAPRSANLHMLSSRRYR